MVELEIDREDIHDRRLRVMRNNTYIYIYKLDRFRAQWERPARNRILWRQLGKAYVQQRNRDIEQSQG